MIGSVVPRTQSSSANMYTRSNNGNSWELILMIVLTLSCSCRTSSNQLHLSPEAVFELFKLNSSLEPANSRSNLGIEAMLILLNPSTSLRAGAKEIQSNIVAEANVNNVSVLLDNDKNGFARLAVNWGTSENNLDQQNHTIVGPITKKCHETPPEAKSSNKTRGLNCLKITDTKLGGSSSSGAKDAHKNRVQLVRHVSTSTRFVSQEADSRLKRFFRTGRPIERHAHASIDFSTYQMHENLHRIQPKHRGRRMTNDLRPLHLMSSMIDAIEARTSSSLVSKQNVSLDHEVIRSVLVSNNSKFDRLNNKIENKRQTRSGHRSAKYLAASELDPQASQEYQYNQQKIYAANSNLNINLSPNISSNSNNNNNFNKNTNNNITSNSNSRRLDLHQHNLQLNQFISENELIELLAQFYAHFHEVQRKVDQILERIFLINSTIVQDTSSSYSNANELSKVNQILATKKILRNRTLTSKATSDSTKNPFLSKDELQDYIKSLKMKFGADDKSLREWLAIRKREFKSLEKANIDFISEEPKSSIVVCSDGPKILIVQRSETFNPRDVFYCFTHDYWINKLWAEIHIAHVHYPVILLNVLLFLIGTLGNIFVCLSVYRNHQLRNVTNYYIVNLAFADLLVIIFCLLPTTVWDLSLTWFFGNVPCKLIMYLQDVSISVSVLTLTAISIDRYYAICYPLRFKSSLNQAKRVIAIIWLISLTIMLPDLIYLKAMPSYDLNEAGLDTVLYSDCNYTWSQQYSSYFQFVKTILLYFLPFVFMFCAHFKIMNTLKLASERLPSDRETYSVHSAPIQLGPNQQRKNHLEIQVDKNEETKSIEIALTDLNRGLASSCEPQSTTVLPEKNDTKRQSIFANGSSSKCGHNCERQNLHKTHIQMHNKTQLESRRNAAKMLMLIVIMFGICYLPVHLINFLRQFIENIPQNDVTSTLAMLAHSFCYLNSAMNPIIYNHMNSVFRAEFKKSLSYLMFWRTKS